ncbi:MAG: response regulator [Candidatus Binatia bacterium]
MLIVEDHPDALDILTHLLEFLGYSVITAEHGVEGVEKALKEKPHLILMDILMPIMDGKEATRKIRSNPETHNIPILATTVLNREQELRSCIEAGCNDYLIKPFTLKQLEGKIQEYIPSSSPTIQ